jgi:hypothetical protein
VNACLHVTFFSLLHHQFNEATVFVGDLNLGDADEDDIKFYSNDSETNLGDIPRAEATGLRPLTSNSALKRTPTMDSRPMTRNGTRVDQAFNVLPRPMTQQSQRLHTPGYEEMLNRRAKFERIVTPATQSTRVNALKNGPQVSKSPSRIEVLKSLRQSPDAVRPSTSSGLPQHSNVKNSSEQQWPQSFSVSSSTKKEIESVPLDDIAERVVKLLYCSPPPPHSPPLPPPLLPNTPLFQERKKLYHRQKSLGFPWDLVSYFLEKAI